jgi:transcriptional regulator with XRE-family HTH domain
MKLGEKIFTLRTEKHMSAADLGNKLNRSESTIRMWESNNSKPDIETLAEISKIFQCTTDYLLSLTPHRNNEAKSRVSDEVAKLCDNLAIFDDKDPDEFINELNKLILTLHGWKFDMSAKYALAPFMLILTKLSEVMQSRVDYTNLSTEYDKTLYPLCHERLLKARIHGDDKMKHEMTKDEAVLDEEFKTRYRLLLNYNVVKENCTQELQTIMKYMDKAIYDECRNRWEERNQFFGDHIAGS